jgi:uncharacterized protein (UPF0262 family)
VSRGDPRQRLINVHLDEKTLVRRSAEVEHERAIAIYDLLDGNYFRPIGAYDGPYILHVGLLDNRLIFDVRDEQDGPLLEFALALTPFRGIVKDYFLVCESYYAAIRAASPAQIEAIDGGRRSLHNEGSELLRERLAGKVEVDLDTARRLFSLVCVLHVRG